MVESSLHRAIWDSESLAKRSCKLFKKGTLSRDHVSEKFKPHVYLLMECGIQTCDSYAERVSSL